MSELKNAKREGRILHVHPAAPDPLLGFHLKRLSYSNDWRYRSAPLQPLADLGLGASDIVVLDFFAHPLAYSALRADLEQVLEGSDASYLLVFPRAFSSNVAPMSGVNCEYCFLGLDGIEEITMRVELVRARSARFNEICDGFRGRTQPASEFVLDHFVA